MRPTRWAAVPQPSTARRAAAGGDQDLAALADQLRADEQALTQLARDHYADRLISRAEFLAARQAIEARMEATHRALSERPRSGILLDVPSTEGGAANGVGDLDRRPTPRCGRGGVTGGGRGSGKERQEV